MQAEWQQGDHKLQAIQWARNILEDDNFYLLDTETTGLGSADEVVQIGIVDSRGQTVFNSYVKPTQLISPQATAVNGITQSDLINAPSLEAIYPTVRDILHKRPVVAYNFKFDERLLKQSLRRYDLKTITLKPNHCAMEWYAQYYGQVNPRFGSYRWHSLNNACLNERVPIQNAHSAIGDCLLTLALIKKIAEAKVD